MKILFITPDFSPHFYGGGGVFASKLVEEIRRNGHIVDVISTNLLTPETIVINQTPQGSNYFLQPVSLGPFQILYKKIKALKIYSFYSKISIQSLLGKLNTKTNYQIIQAFAFPGHPGQDELLKKLKNIYPEAKIALYSHSVPSIFQKNPITKIIYYIYLHFWAKNIAALSPILLANSASALSGLPKLLIKRKITMILSPGVDTQSPLQFSKTLAEKYKINDDDRLLISIGTITWHKNQLKTIRIFHELNELEPNNNFKLIFVGQTNQAKLKMRLDQAVEKLNLKNKIIFTGFVQETEKYQMLNRAEVLISSSVKEGFGMTLLEAMSLEKLVYVTRAEGHNDIVVEGENGHFYPGEDESLIAQKLISILSHGDTKEIKLRAKRFAKGFSWPNIAKRYLEICENLIEGKYEIKD
jgi:glycosyltransferase involved in cell wall biosynthesis